jgi:chemotaxis protein CheZ
MSNNVDVLHQDYVERTRELLRHMEQGSADDAARVLDELTKLREDSLFQELGKLTREFHEALNNFRLDSRIQNLAQRDIPDARDRLSYVITMTEQAANRTLSAVERSLPMCESLEQSAVAMRAQWGKLMRKEMDAQTFRTVSRDMEEFLITACTTLPAVRAQLQDVLMAQGFQDLTGQIIRRVMTLVEELETNLVALVRMSGQHLLPEAQPEHPTAASGPAIPGIDKGTVSGQDEVDDLLSSLGF